MSRKIEVAPLSEMTNGQEADLFAMMTIKEELTTRDGKPYFRVGFRDAGREVQFPIWNDSPWGADCRDQWQPGLFYKIRAVYRDTNYGPQLDIRKIREAVDADCSEGFDPNMLLRRTRFDAEAMFEELVETIKLHVRPDALRDLVVGLLQGNRDDLLVWPAARSNHHAYVGGLLEHTLSVVRTSVYLAAKYAEYYPEMSPPLNTSLVVAGAALHDVGKLRELETSPSGGVYSAEGHLIGHILQGRDMLRQAAADCPIDAELLLRLEHIIVSHQRLPEWGSPKPPMTPEALLVHYADDIDAKYHMVVDILAADSSAGPVTSRKNVLRQHLFRGLE
jgi:3'-5' exoribonuclease